MAAEAISLPFTWSAIVLSLVGIRNGLSLQLSRRWIMLRKLPSALGVGVLLMKSLRVALPPSTAWFVGMPLLDTTRFSFTTQRNKFQLNLEKQRRCRCFFCFELFIKHQKICSFRCVDNIIEYATMGLWRASVSCLFCISNLAKYHIHVKVGRLVNLQNF